LIKIFKYLLFFLLLFSSIKAQSEECKSDKLLRVALLDNSYINYNYYLLYTLNDFSFKNNLNFELSYYEDNPNEFDIIFGEYYDLKKINQREILIPTDLINFYKQNSITVSNNIFPLDLDTFILASKQNLDNIGLEGLSKLHSTTFYTLGLSFLPEEKFINFISDIFEGVEFKNYNVNFESKFTLLRENYKNMNKNILLSNFDEIYNSYENSENLFTLFSDGIILYKGFDFKTYQRVPKSKYSWNEEDGFFKIKNNFESKSFFGFSALLNNSSHSSFLCYLTKRENRLNAFKNFNIELGPLSENEILPIKDSVSEKYIELLQHKNQNITELNYSDYIKNHKSYMDLISNEKDFERFYPDKNYLN
tara:strand:+ start:1430 stop:2521 length:1092 start_codon:yes stop_codon:yes gene_type:complete